MKSATCNRLHLGASSLELLSRTPTAEFISAEWLHLGDQPNFEARSDTGSLKSRVRAIGKRILRRSGAVAGEGSASLYSKTNFQPWIFRLGDSLPCEDSSVSFIYSEHVMEHFRFDIALELFRECFRVLRPGGVVRTVVPDPDYRTYENPEMVGFPGRKLPMNHPNKHKVRWSRYMLGSTLEVLGFQAVPIIWCDDNGVFHQENPADHAMRTADPEMVATLRYVQRPRSLIIDGVKPL